MNKRVKGFTLAELSISSLIAGLLFISVISLYIFAWQSFVKGNTYLDSYAGSRNASGWMVRDIRCAAQVVEQYPLTGPATYQTGDSVIVLRAPSINSSGMVISPGLDYIIYELQGGDLHRIVQADTSSSRLNENRVIARYCNSLNFSSGGVALSSIPNLSTINTIAIYLPINKSNTALAETTAEKINPTTVVRLRNK
jgi:hypothetical protein